MQLHRLRLAAIGPFVEPVEIDLDRLSASGIFLLEGPTGAGKSTLIDAVVYALYGDVAGKASSTQRIASAVAPDDATPSVELDFSTSHGMFRIRRSPKHARRKRRGSGTTIENASGALWRLVSPDANAVGEPIATRLDEIGAEVLDIVGLSCEQFVQTVVLPQGEFATFLRADAEHRRSLLQKLFGTEIYDRTVDRLVELRRAAHSQRAAAATAVIGSVSAYCGALGISRDDEEVLIDRVERDPEGALAAVQQQLDAIAGAVTTATTVLRDATADAARARAHHAELGRREAARRRLVALRDQLAVLDADADTLDRDVRRAAAAAEAARLMATITGLTEARGRAAEAAAALAAATRELPDPAMPIGEWQARERHCTERAAALQPLLEIEEGLIEARRQLDARRSEREELSVQCERLAAVLAQGPDTVTALRGALDDARQCSGTLPAARLQLEAAKAIVRSAQDLVAAEAEVDRAKQEVAKAARRARTLTAREAQLRVRFIDGMAGHLAAALEPEQPCPVCGSPEHPSPARSTESVDRAELDDAAEQVDVATRHVESLRESLSALESAAAELRGVVGSRSVEDALGELAASEQRVAQAEAAELRVVQLDHELVDVQRLLVERRTLLDQAEQARLLLDALISATEVTLDKDEARVLAALDGHASLTLRAAALTGEALLWQKALGALESATATDRDVQVRAAEVEAALSGSIFSTAEEARAAYVDDQALKQLRQSIESRQAARTRCEAELRAPELSSVKVDDVIDLEASRLAAEAAEAALAGAQARHGQLCQRLSDGQTRGDEVQSSLSAQRTVVGSTAATIRMADLASASTADNAKSMSLPTFVLRERFADVVASANERLATMSDGRYRLEHVEDRRGNRKSGLDLQIRDAHSEHARDPATLSGGESFYCSLALALGLADVVTAEAGGVDLGTLFVDEGFGSLDADTLEQVLGVLQGLASGGRVVGIVSHVPELREQVAERISVIPNRDGSSRLIVAA